MFIQSIGSTHTLDTASLNRSFTRTVTTRTMLSRLGWSYFTAQLPSHREEIVLLNEDHHAWLE